MKRRLLYVLGSSLIVLLFASPVAAVTNDATTNSGAASSNASNSTSSSTPSSSTTTTPKAATTLAERLAKRTAALKTALTAAEKTKLQSKCKASQALIKTLNTTVTTNSEARVKVYDGINTQLTDLLTKLKNNTTVDVSTLQTELVTLQTKLTTYKTDVADYQQTLGDLNEMDCATDPTAFKASLESGRTTRESLAKQIADIRLYVTGTIKPTLNTIKTQIAANSTTN